MLITNAIMSAVVFVRTNCYTVIPYDTERDLFVIAEFSIL